MRRGVGAPSAACGVRPGETYTFAVEVAEHAAWMRIVCSAAPESAVADDPKDAATTSSWI